MVTVDDTNTIQLKYDNKWFHGNWTDTSTQPPSNRSLLSSNDVTAQMVLVFPVVGTGFSYYGMKRSGGGLFRVCIDCDPNQPAGPFDTIDALNETDDGHNPPVLLYSKQGLSNDMHTVVLMNTNDTRLRPQGASQITLDRFEITTLAPPVVTVTNSAQISATAPVVPNASESKGASINPGIIAGVIIGALALLALMIGLFLCLRRKRRASRDVSVEDGGTPEDASMPDPLVVDQLRHVQRPNPGSILTLSTKGLSPSVAPRNTAEFSSPLRTGSEAPVSTSTPPITSPTTMPSTNRRMETDAGPVRDDGDTLPPDYAQVFNSQLQPGPTASVSLGMMSGQNDEPRRGRKRS